MTPFVCEVSHQHLSTEAHEEQVQVYRGDATDKEGKKFGIFFFFNLGVLYSGS